MTDREEPSTIAVVKSGKVGRARNLNEVVPRDGIFILGARLREPVGNTVGRCMRARGAKMERGTREVAATCMGLKGIKWK